MTDTIAQRLAALRKDDILTDCTIFTFDSDDFGESPPWRAHRLALAVHSTPILERCKKDPNEKNEYTLDLTRWREGVVERLISFLYTLDYDREDEYLHIHAEMFQIADEEDIPGLKALSLEKLAANLDISGVAAVKELDNLLVGDGLGIQYDGLCDMLVKYAIDIGAFGEGSSFRGYVLELAREYEKFGVAVIKELGRREQKRKNVAG